MADEEKAVPKEQVESKEGNAATQAELEQTKQLLARAQEEVKAQQREVSKKAEELKRQQDFADRLTGIETNMAILGAAFDEKGNPEEELEETSKKAKPSVEERVKATELKGKENQVKDIGNEVVSLAKDIGLDYATAPELENIRDKLEGAWAYRDPNRARRALEVVKKMVDARKEEKDTPKETEEEKVNKLVEARLSQVLKERGLLTPEGFIPGSSINETLEALHKTDTAKMSQKDLLVHKKALEAALSKGT